MLKLSFMQKDKVYFLKDFNRLDQALDLLLKDFYPKNSSLSVKIHFGEPGNKAAFTTKDIKPITDFLKKESLNFYLMDTPVVYPSPRNTVQGYLLITKLKGFDKLGKCLISDQYKKIKTKDFEAEVSLELISADCSLVISHVKGHSCSGFGGAIKNLGMGGVSKKTKNIEHTLCKPILDKDKCTSCKKCEQVCPAKAIKIKDKYPEIDLEKCYGCSICEDNCPSKSLTPQQIIFDDLLAQAASVVINHLPKKTFYINFLKNIVENCDCSMKAGKTLCPDLGILFSKNPVAIDKASVDLINQFSKKNLFQERFNKDPLLHLKYTSEYSNFSLDYELEDLSNNF